MKIAAWDIHDYALPLARPLPGPSPFPGERRGLLLSLGDAGGSRALGEAAPLPGFSAESLEEARDDLRRFAAEVIGRHLPAGLAALDGGFDDWLGADGYCPSARFAIESAVLGLVALAHDCGVARLLNADAAPRVAVNGLVAGEPASAISSARRLVAAGHRTLKLKVGGRDPVDDGRLVAAVREAVGSDTRLRVDANRAWSLAAARSFLAALDREPAAPGAAVHYVEEPVSDLEGFRALLGTGGPGLALDEGLRELEPAALDDLPGLRAIVVKPTLLGIERAAAFARRARGLDIEVVVSACFESGVGIRTLAHLAAAWSGPDTAAGLGTLEWFEHDLLAAPLSAAPAVIAVDRGPAAETRLNHARLRRLQDPVTQP